MRLIFIGTGEIGLPVLRSLLSSPDHKLVGVITQPDKPVGRSQQIEPTPVKAAVAHTSIPVLQPKRIRQDDAVAAVRDLAPDCIVVMAYGQIIPRSVLEIPRLACLNLHASLLPRHRGAAPIQASILEGDRESGITVMYMDEGLDTGDILLQIPIELAPDETGGSLHDRLSAVAPDALHQALAQLQDGTAPRSRQDPTAVTYARKLERENGRIEWNDSAISIERKIRAFNPWPGTFMELKCADGQERKLKIFRASLVDSAKSSPGKIFPSGHSIAVTAKDGALELNEVQLEGKRRMTGAEFLRGHSEVIKR